MIDLVTALVVLAIFTFGYLAATVYYEFVQKP